MMNFSKLLTPFMVIVAALVLSMALASSAGAAPSTEVCDKIPGKALDALRNQANFCPPPVVVETPDPIVVTPEQPEPVVDATFTAHAGPNYTIVVERAAGGLLNVHEVDFWWVGVPDGYSNSTGIPKAQTDMIVEWTDTRIIVQFPYYYAGVPIRKMALRSWTTGLWYYGEVGEVDHAVNFDPAIVISA